MTEKKTWTQKAQSAAQDKDTQDSTEARAARASASYTASVIGVDAYLIDTTTGLVSADAIVKVYQVNKRELASAVGLGPDSLSRAERIRSPKVQARLREATEILHRVQPWAGSESAAWAWYRSTGIPALGDLTPEELVSRGQSEDVKAYLTHLADGGYA